MTKPPTPTLYWESKVADRLGVSRTRLRELRKQHLRPGDHFTTNEGNAITLTQAGLDVIMRVLAQGAPKPAGSTRGPAPDQPAANVPPGPPEKKCFVIVRVPAHRIDNPQRKIVICRGAIGITPGVPAMLPNPAEPERPIRVRDNTNFRAGMVLEAVNVGYGMWQYLGRLPRRPGRW